MGNYLRKMYIVFVYANVTQETSTELERHEEETGLKRSTGSLSHCNVGNPQILQKNIY